MRVLLRGKYQRSDDVGVFAVEHADALTAFAEVLRKCCLTTQEPIITWTDGDALAALDVDVETRWGAEPFHTVRFGADEPDYYWQTHGGGFRGIFAARGPLTARERAALFAFLFVRGNRLPYKRIEIKTDTRHPGYKRGEQRCGRVHRGSSAFDAQRIAEIILGGTESVTPEAVAEWLQDRGYTPGRRYDHTRCPISPSAKGKGNPVIFTDSGVHCYYCKANAATGFLPYAAILDPRRRRKIDHPVMQCARGKCHWDHARFVIESSLDWRGKIAEHLYSALLKSCHRKSDDPEEFATAQDALLSRATYPPIPIVRMKGIWVKSDDFAPFQGGLDKIIPELPAAKYIDREDCKRKTCQLTAGILRSNSDLSKHAYPHITPIQGVDYDWGLDDKLKVVVPANPPYGSKGFDMPLLDAEQWLDRHFPGVNLNLLRLVLIANGVSQTGPNEPPFIFIHGQSESAKTSHVMLAAQIACSHMAKVSLTDEEVRFLQAIGAASGQTSIILLDEVSKSGRRLNNLTKQLLSVTMGQHYHVPHQNSAPLSIIPAIIMADTVVPTVIREEVQLARRIVEVNLGSGISITGKDWRDTCGSDRDLRKWRAHCDKNTVAADVFLRDVIENFRGIGFFDAAKKLGFRTFRDAIDDSADELRDRQKLFYRAVCDAPIETAGRAKRGKEYKLLDLDAATPLTQAYCDLIGEVTGSFYANQVQKVKGAQWGRIIGVPGVECDFSPKSERSRTVRVRFRLGDSRSPQVRYNAEILKSTSDASDLRHDGNGSPADSNQLGAESADLHRHGNAVDPRHYAGRLASLFGMPDNSPHVASGSVPGRDDSLDTSGPGAEGILARDPIHGDVPF